MLVAIFDWLRYRFHRGRRIRRTLCHPSFAQNNTGFSTYVSALYLRSLRVYITRGILALPPNRKSVTVNRAVCGVTVCLSLSLTFLFLNGENFSRRFIKLSINQYYALYTEHVTQKSLMGFLLFLPKLQDRAECPIARTYPFHMVKYLGISNSNVDAASRSTHSISRNRIGFTVLRDTILF